MKIILITLLSFITLFGVEVNEANLADSISKCEARDGNICKDIADFYFKKFTDSYSSDRDSEAKALAYDTKACELKNGSACYSVAIAYGERIGFDKSTPQDPIKELEYLNKGCDYKNADACLIAGHRYLKEAESKSGADKKATELKAKRFYKKTCDLGYKLGCDM